MMPANVSTQTQLNNAAAAAKKTFVFNLLIAICWPISATIMWVTYANYPSAVLAAAIAFTGIAIVYIARAANSYAAYTKARKAASITHK